MQPNTTVYCNNIGTYDGQLTKRKSYLVEEADAENIRIRNDRNQLKWYNTFYFGLERQPEIVSIHLDGEISNALSDLVEVTIEFSDDERYWTSFTTPEYLKELLVGQPYISTNKFIVISELSEEKIKHTIFDLDNRNQLPESCNKY